MHDQPFPPATPPTPPAPALRPLLLWPLALAVGVALFALTSLIEPARPDTLNFGTEYGQMAEDPFGLLGKFPHRILGPLLAHWLGLAGPGYAWFAHGCTTALIALLFAGAVLRGARVGPALAITAAIAFTGTIQLYKGHVGYPDPITFALLLASILAVKRPALFWSLQALNLANHEQILFFWPWLLWWRRREARADWRHDAAGVLVVGGAYTAWRLWVGAHAAEQKLTFEHYTMLDYFPWGTLGLSILNVASTFMWFGVMPVLVCWHAFVDGWRRAGWPLVGWLLSIFAIFAVAHDVYRFTCFLFVPLFFAGLRLVQERHGAWILVALTAATVAAIRLQAPVFVDVGLQVLYDMGAEGGPVLRQHPVLDIVPIVLPSRPWTFVAYGLATVASVVAGRAWARWSRQHPASR